MRIFGFAGFSGSGKTTLIEKLIPVLRARGLTVFLIKHAHHGFGVDRPGKDSASACHTFRSRRMGCVLIRVLSGRLRNASQGGSGAMRASIASTKTRIFGARNRRSAY